MCESIKEKVERVFQSQLDFLLDLMMVSLTASDHEMVVCLQREVLTDALEGNPQPQMDEGKP
jgi:hypothetical protein